MLINNITAGVQLSYKIISTKTNSSPAGVQSRAEFEKAISIFVNSIPNAMDVEKLNKEIKVINALITSYYKTPESPDRLSLVAHINNVVSMHNDKFLDCELCQTEMGKVAELEPFEEEKKPQEKSFVIPQTEPLHPAENFG